MKAQVAIINEIITVTIGVSLVIGLAVFISNLLVPNIQNYVAEEELGNFLNYMDLSMVKIYDLTKESESINITLKSDLPDRLLESIYYLSVEGRNLCILIEGTGNRKCQMTSLPATVGFSGYYISGTNIKFELLKYGVTSMQFSNSY